MTQQRGNHLHVEEAAFDCPVVDIDLRRLQLGFSELFDRAAQAVQRLGLDVDDVVFDRVLVCRTTNVACLEVVADWVADKERLIAHIQSHLAQASTPTARGGDLATLRIVALKVIVRCETLPTRDFPSRHGD
jgi:hypothetical protein